MTNDIDWNKLRTRASAVAEHAYAPYSNLHVGAAALVDDGRVVTGCNVENASYGLGLCAECGLASNLHSSGGGRLVAVSIVDGDGNYLTPCGRCRQVLIEFGGAELLVDSDDGVRTLGDLLPDAFTPETLRERTE